MDSKFASLILIGSRHFFVRHVQQVVRGCKHLGLHQRRTTFFSWEHVFVGEHDGNATLLESVTLLFPQCHVAIAAESQAQTRPTGADFKAYKRSFSHLLPIY
jgi:hypothetical protein